MRNPGKLVIVAIVAVAFGAALLSLLYHRQSGRRALALWGTESAVLIAQAPDLDAMKLQPADAHQPSSPRGRVEKPAEDEPAEAEPAVPARPSLPSHRRWIRHRAVGHRRAVLSRDGRDRASKARGVSNIRRALVLDATFAWNEPAAENPTWQYVLEFRDQGRSVMVFFDFEAQQVGSNSTTKTTRLDPAANDDWRTFFEEQFEAPAK